MRLKNRLWNPEHETIKHHKKTIKNHLPDDFICLQCPNKEHELPDGKKITCQNMCYPLTWVDGNVGLKETLLDKQYEPSSDYNSILADGISARRIDYTNRLISEKLKIRCVAVLLEAEFSIQDIAHLLKCSSRNIYRLK
jgi:hypothetical protein